MERLGTDQDTGKDLGQEKEENRESCSEHHQPTRAREGLGHLANSLFRLSLATDKIIILFPDHHHCGHSRSLLNAHPSLP